MAGQIHGIMQQSEHVDCGGIDSGIGAVQDEMAAPPSSTRDVKDPDVFADIIALPGAEQIWPFRQRPNGLAQGIRIDASLTRTKVARSPNQNVLNVSLGRRPSYEYATCDVKSINPQVDSRECSPIASRANSSRWRFSCSGVSKLWKFPGVDVSNANLGCFPQSLQLSFVFPFLTLNQSNPLAQNFTGVLIAPRGNHLLDERFLLFRENDVSRRHDPCSEAL